MLFVPDKIFTSISDITAELLEKEGIKGLVLDIDYTLAPKSAPMPDDTAVRFVKSLKQAGVSLYIISNNHKDRVSKFAEALEIDYVFNGLKPLPRAFRRAARKMGLAPGQVAAVGDQIFTDVYGAHAAGMKAWLVAPKGNSLSFFYSLRRRFEQPFIRRYYKNKEGKGR